MSLSKKLLITTSLTLCLLSVAFETTQALTFTEVVNLLQAPDINLPTGVTNPKGNIGFILSNLFWGTADGIKNGKIKPQYIDYSGISAWTQSGSDIVQYATGNVFILNNLGIGTMISSDRLTLSGSAGPIIGLNGPTTNYRGLKMSDSTGAEKWFAGANNLGNYVIRQNNTTDLMTFSGGLVGIGTSNPEANLDIYSATPHLRISDSTDKDTWAFGDIFSSIDFYSNDSYDAGPRVGAYIRAEHLRAGTGHIAADIGLAFGISGANSSPAYQTPYTAMVISNAGNVGIGITTPAQRLDVVGNIKTSGCLYYASSSLGTCVSDERLKKDISPFTLGLDTVLGLQPKHFKYNGLGGLQDDDIEQIGVVAQDVEKIAPSLIKKQKVQLHPNDQKQTEIKAVDYGSFTYLLINAIKELKTQKDSEIGELKRQNEKLLKRIEKLEKK